MLAKTIGYECRDEQIDILNLMSLKLFLFHSFNFILVKTYL